MRLVSFLCNTIRLENQSLSYSYYLFSKQSFQANFFYKRVTFVLRLYKRKWQKPSNISKLLNLFRSFFLLGWYRPSQGRLECVMIIIPICSIKLDEFCHIFQISLQAVPPPQTPLRFFAPPQYVCPRQTGCLSPFGALVCLHHMGSARSDRLLVHNGYNFGLVVSWSPVNMYSIVSHNLFLTLIIW